MRPIAHARRLSSRVAASRHAVDAVVVGNPVPLGIPALFLADQLSRGRTAEQILSGKRGLTAEYAGAEGYAYRSILRRRTQGREQRPEPYGLIKRRSVSTVLGLPMFIRLNAGCSGLSR